MQSLRGRVGLAAAALTLVLAVAPTTARAGLPTFKAKKTETSFIAGDATIRVWQYAPTEGKGPWPGVVLLYGLDGLDPDEFAKSQLIYALIAGKIAEKGFVVHLVLYFDRVKFDAKDIPDLKLALRRQLLDLEQKGVDAKTEKLYRAWMATVKEGVDNLRKNKDVDDKRIGLVGVSMGGFLGTSVVVEYPGLKLLCLGNIFGGLPPPEYAKVRDNKLKLPPLMVMGGEEDDIVPEKFQRDLFDLWRATGNRGEGHFYGGVGHAFYDKAAGAIDRELAFNEALPAAIRFLKRHLAPPAKKDDPSN
jgi:dienelactone hydrolase